MSTFEDLRRERQEELLQGADGGDSGASSLRPTIYLFVGIAMVLSSIAITSFVIEAALKVLEIENLQGKGWVVFGTFTLLHFASLLIRLPAMLLGMKVFGVSSSSIGSAALRLVAITEFSTGAFWLTYVLSTTFLGPVPFLIVMAIAAIAIFANGWSLTSEFFELDGLDPLWCWGVILVVDAAVIAVLRQQMG